MADHSDLLRKMVKDVREILTGYQRHTLEPSDSAMIDHGRECGRDAYNDAIRLLDAILLFSEPRK